MDSRYDTIQLFFEEAEHKYTDSFGNEYKSVTTLIQDYYEHFNTKYWAHKQAKEQGRSEKAITAEWDKIREEACDRGTATHNGLENAIKSVSKFKDAIRYLEDIKSGRCITVADIPAMIPKPLDIEEFKKATDNKYPEIYRVFEHYTNKGYIIFSEICAFLPDYLISGTIDILCYKPTDFVILDWKTNRGGLKFEAGYYKKDKSVIPNQLTSEWVYTKTKMLPPVGHLEDCNGMHYSLQLSLYAIMCEIIFDIPCVGLGLCHIESPWVLNKYGQPYRDKDGFHVNPDGNEVVTWFKINYLKNEVKAILKDRYDKLKASNKLANKQMSLF
jgi:hypothetical protein